MKKFVVLSLLFVAGTVAAQPTDLDRSIATQLGSPNSTVLTLKERPDEITVGRFTYSGIAVQAVKAPNPLQLINPFAPPEYGTGTNNLLQNSSGRGIGLKFFSINF